MVKVSPTWVFMVVAFAALVVVHHSNTHVGLLDARERRHAEEVKRLRAMIDHAQRSADAGGAPVAPADAPPPPPAAAGDAAARCELEYSAFDFGAAAAAAASVSYTHLTLPTKA
mgnify:CR=1 FL=1